MCEDTLKKFPAKKEEICYKSIIHIKKYKIEAMCLCKLRKYREGLEAITISLSTNQECEAYLHEKILLLEGIKMNEEAIKLINQLKSKGTTLKDLDKIQERIKKSMQASEKKCNKKYI